MSLGTSAADGRTAGMVGLVAGVTLVLLAGLAHLALQPAPPAVRAPTEPLPIAGSPRVASTPIAPPSLAPPPAAAQTRPGLAAVPPAPSTPAPPVDMPYRFVGRSASGADASIVLFGRGRVVSLREPGPLDDEHAVEAVYDDYLVLRHVPSGTGKFLALERRQQVAGPPRDPDDSPRD
jgi:hypothetical protein